MGLEDKLRRYCIEIHVSWQAKRRLQSAVDNPDQRIVLLAPVITIEGDKCLVILYLQCIYVCILDGDL